MKTNFKVGDKVWDGYRYPKMEGNVIRIDPDSCMSRNLIVVFGGIERQYTKDGRLYTDCNPTLSKVPYTFQLPEQPVEFEEGDPVLVRDDEYMTWKTGRFISMSGKRFFIEHGGCQMRWNCCIPFDLEKMGHV